MAFHLACSITCRRICDCELGFSPALRDGAARREGFLAEIARLEEFLRDPWCVRAADTVQVAVPRVTPAPPAAVAAASALAEDGEDAVRRAATQHQAVAASLAAEDYVRRLEAGGITEVEGEVTRDDQISSAAKVICRICFSGEYEGSDKAVKMLPCKFCSKKYHKSCLKNWAGYRDLFHWSSWACPSCRICEVCRRAGDPNKLMYCKRCDAAYHCYCQQPPHKNVSHGPYLCQKHTRCHSCGSNVPGSGLSTRWLLGYTCCDACGRLFTKGNYCPVCLKVYRDSETTPMVCCDVCERWVHCSCDGISEEKYQQFQADQNLSYKCAACRGDCYQVTDFDDAVRELWKRKDEGDRDLIITLRAAAGLPSQEEISSICPCSDDEHSGPVVLKNDSGRPLKFSVKGFSDKSTKYSNETNFLSPSKKLMKKKGCQIKFIHKSEEPYQNFGKQHQTRSLESCFGDKFEGLETYIADGLEIFPSSMIQSPCNDEVNPFIYQPGNSNHRFIKETVANNVDRVSRGQNKGEKLQDLSMKDSAGKIERKSETIKGTKLVIHLGAKNSNSSSSPRSENSSCHREQDVSASYGGDDASHLKTESKHNYLLEGHGDIFRLDVGKGARFDDINQRRRAKHEHREKNIVKLGKVSDSHRRNGNVTQEYELAPIHESPPVTGKRSTYLSPATRAVAEAAQDNDLLKKKLSFTPEQLQSVGRDTSHPNFKPNISSDLKPLLKLKFKNPYFEQQCSWAPRGEEESFVKGQRSKRKRPSADKVVFRESLSSGKFLQENPIDEAMDAKILQKLGQDAVGKGIEVHQLSDNSWHQGVVSGTTGGSSSLTVRLDDGRTTTLDLGKQGVRFVAQKKQKRTT